MFCRAICNCKLSRIFHGLNEFEQLREMEAQITASGPQVEDLIVSFPLYFVI